MCVLRRDVTSTVLLVPKPFTRKGSENVGGQMREDKECLACVTNYQWQSLEEGAGKGGFGCDPACVGIMQKVHPCSSSSSGPLQTSAPVPSVSVAVVHGSSRLLTSFLPNGVSCTQVADAKRDRKSVVSGRRDPPAENKQAPF